MHRQDLLRCLSASGLAGLPMSDRSEPRPEALPRESSGHGAASSSIEARREEDDESSAPQKYATRSLLLHALRTFRYRSARWGEAALGRALQRAPPPSAAEAREAPPKTTTIERPCFSNAARHTFRTVVKPSNPSCRPVESDAIGSEWRGGWMELQPIQRFAWNSKR